jgi:hypothetical protein
MITITREHGGMVADCDLFATQDGRLVEADDPAANSLVARKGMPIPENLVESLGIELTKTGRVKDQDEGTAVHSTAADPPKDEEKKADAKDAHVLSRDSIKHVGTGRKD